MQTKEGAIKLAAKYYGLSVEEYLEKIKHENYCNKCKKWKNRSNFCKDKSRQTGLHKNCKECRWVNGGKKRNGQKGKPSSPMRGRHFSGKALKNIQRAVRRSNKKRTGKKIKFSKDGYKRKTLASRKSRPSMRGSHNPNWKGGITKDRNQRYYSAEYKSWRRCVFERDNYTCQDCGDKKGGNLEAHHIKEAAKYPELLLEISNGITLCKRCHERRHFNPNSTRNKIRKQKGIKLKF